MATEEIVLNPTSLPHIFLCDIEGTGLLKEIAVVKKFKDGTINYIDIDPLHPIDKARLKKIVVSAQQRQDSRGLWEIMSESRLSNGMNALDFFHTNCVKVKRPKGSRGAVGSIIDVPTVTDKMIGSEFTNPAEAKMDKATREFK